VNDDRESFDALVSALESTGQRVKGKSCTCPWHDDENPSASLLQGEMGRWRIYCHTCDRAGDVFDIRSLSTGRNEFKATMMTQTHNFPCKVEKCLESKSNSVTKHASGTLGDKKAVAALAAKIGAVEAWYSYGPIGAPVLVVARIIPHEGGKKTFRQFSSHDDGTWSASNILTDGTIPLYRQHEIGAVTLVVEGEKACDAVSAMGFPCVTSAMGAGKAHLSDWSALVGKKAILWPDNDVTDTKTGRNVGALHMQEVASILDGLGVEHQTIDPTKLDLPAKGDAYDFIMKHGADADDRMRELIEAHSVDKFLAHLSKQMAGDYASVPWPWKTMTETTKALLPGAVTLLVGNAGATKSFMLLESATFWISKGHKVAVCELEENKEFWQQRVMAQLAQFSQANDPDWIKENPAAAMEVYKTHADKVQEFGACVHSPPAIGYTLKQLADWIEGRAKDKCRVIVADPITACKPEGREPWNEAQSFILRVKNAAAKYGCSIVLATHGRKGQEKSKAPPDMDSMAGGASYARFASSVIWVDPLPAAKTVTVIGDDGSEIDAHINRRVRILKSRNGKGTGMVLGMFFDGSSFATIERGVILRESKDSEPPSGPKPSVSHTVPSSRGPKLAKKPDASEDLFDMKAETP
jgi:hypothetical protein